MLLVCIGSKNTPYLSLLFSPVSTIPLMHHAHISLPTANVSN